jgi:hypothetical protein
VPSSRENASDECGCALSVFLPFPTKGSALCGLAL